MITELTTPFVKAKDEYIAWLKATADEYPSYEKLLKKALEVAVAGRPDADFNAGRHRRYWEDPDPERIHSIDDGDYQGTLVFVIGAKGYQPDTYWSTKVSYGSCSGCDALEDAYDYGMPSFEAMYTIALHMMQGLREI